MENSENTNSVTQNSNEVDNGDIVGRDKNVSVINFFSIGALNIEKLAGLLQKDSGREQDYIQRFLQLGKNESNQSHSIDQNLLLFEVLKSSVIGIHNDEIEGEYVNILLGNTMESTDEKIKYSIKEAAHSVKKLDFKKAHELLGDSLKAIKSDHSKYAFIYKEYLITGFIWYSRQNNTNGLKSLLSTKSEITNAKNPETDYIISLIFQEIFSRDTQLNNLREVVSTLDRIYSNASDTIKPAMANSLGLAYRRLGERTGTFYLEKAVNIFSEGLKLNNNDKKIEIELKDQMAAAHIRIFEFTKNEDQLNIAEKLLKGCLELLKDQNDPRGYRLKPRVLNNLGNVFKQKVLVFKEITSAPEAIAYYEEAGQYWTEKDADYDWALLRKNIAETKYALGKLANDKEILVECIQDCIRSIKYRNLKNSPYQWGKTASIVFSSVIILNDLKSINLIPKAAQRKILSYSKTVISDEIKWTENISAGFFENAKQVLKIFN